MPGKHAPDSSSSFYLSLGKAVGGALAALGVMLALVLVLLSGEAEPKGGPTVSGPDPTATSSRTPTRSPTPTPSVLPVSRVTVDVLNGTVRARLARQTADMVEKAGYRIGEVDNGPRTAKSTIFYKPGRRAEALEFQGRFSDFTVLEESESSQRAILRIVVGADWPRT